MLNVLIVEDDLMVAEFNKRYLEQVNGFTLAGIAHSVPEAINVIEKISVNLVLLDVYMPGQNGLELLNYIREKGKAIDVILITAASEIDKVQWALRYGAVDYLVKPFEFERFEKALIDYRENYNFLHNKQNEKIKQQDLDHLLKRDLEAQGQPMRSLPKGLTKSTLRMVNSIVKDIKKTPFSTEDVAERTDISRVSVRKYLKFLKEIKVLEETMVYGVGRPVYLYSYNKKNEVNLDNYL